MNASMGAHTRLQHVHYHGFAWRQRLAGVGVVVLAGLGTYYAISDWLQRRY